ncbi:YiiD C-terminal domain-containing protein [Leptospira harrisiae]|uniref:Thioesterase n=1 Tax=Leptospira harrisiae TaxID=2023189 RepID=A0A2N0AJ28_9LEPT|nr:YiiD C-terminal domain-containing protein [Leptospira harrisiae]PJZ84253.1 thioesterase [Leptospira harrisiae]PKA07831.1 thioesterase [Leptospira harrisiae]
MKENLANSFHPDPKWKWMEFFLGFKKAINLYSPFWGSGIKVLQYNKEKQQINVQLKMNFFNKGYMGTHFGGSLYSMCDPFYVYLLMKNLGSNYMVWDKRAEIEYINKNNNSVFAKFEVSENDIENIKSRLSKQKKIDYTFTINVTDSKENTIALVKKIIYIRKLTPKQKNRI